MTLGIALVIIFVLWLIDKHDKWKQARTFAIWTSVVILFGCLGIYGYIEWGDYQAHKKEATAAAATIKWEDYTAPREPPDDRLECQSWMDCSLPYTTCWKGYAFDKSGKRCVKTTGNPNATTAISNQKAK